MSLNSAANADRESPREGGRGSVVVPAAGGAAGGHPRVRRVALACCTMGLILAAVLVVVSWTAVIEVSRMRIGGGQVRSIAGSIRDGAISFQQATQSAPWSVSGMMPGVVTSWRTQFQRDRGQNALAPSVRPGRVVPSIAATAAGNRYAIPTWNLAAVLAACTWLLARRHRHRSRIEKQQCLGCGYALAGLAPSAPCPECGRGAVPVG